MRRRMRLMTSSSKIGHELITSQLFDEKTFYQAFQKDLDDCVEEVLIESPFITSDRTQLFISTFEKLLNRNVKIYVITRDPREHQVTFADQSEIEISNFERMGIQVLLCLGNHHRKLAIFDRRILWEGSLNILSQTKSREIMRRIEGEKSAREMYDFLKLNIFIR
jgi:phosphatidylserine/phosphatidylglycerophosphate/cardiolipin synthase-like enzyme